jgi:hypothetical protein
MDMTIYYYIESNGHVFITNNTEKLVELQEVGNVYTDKESAEAAAKRVIKAYKE